MFVNDSHEKIYQTLPGQGWQVLVDWNPLPPDLDDGHPRYTLEPIFSLVTAKIPRENDTNQWEDGERYVNRRSYGAEARWTCGSAGVAF